MKFLIDTRLKRIGCSAFIFIIIFVCSLWWTYKEDFSSASPISDGEIMARVAVLPLSFFVATLIVTSLASATPASAATRNNSDIETLKTKPFIAQVVGVQWLNPLQRKDYPTEWQLLWLLKIIGPNKDDEMVESKPEKYRTIQAISHIANANGGQETFEGFHEKYLRSVMKKYRDVYFSDAKYFYNAHSLEDKTTWRELAGIHVEYALPVTRFDPAAVAAATRDCIVSYFDIGNKSFPNAWTRSTPPNVRITMGGENAGFTSLSAGLAYLQANPSQTVWVMNWDAPSFPNDTQLNENMVLLILAGPDYKTERAPLAWLSQPAASKVTDFETKSTLPSRSVQAWKAAIGKATLNAGKKTSDIDFVIHDANSTHPRSSDRLAPLAQTISEEIQELDFMKKTFNTSAVLGEMGAGSALTNVVLAIAYANHIGGVVLVAGTTDPDTSVATIVMPPPIVRPIVPGQPWFRARAANHIYLPWWGLRNDTKSTVPGYSQ